MITEEDIGKQKMKPEPFEVSKNLKHSKAA